MLQSATTKHARNAGRVRASRERTEKTRALDKERRLNYAASAALIGASSPNPSNVTTLTVPLTGSAISNFANPTGGTGDPNGSGSVRLTFDPSKKKVCYDFQLSGVATPLMSHIHRGEPLRNGPPIVTLFTGPGGNLHDCVIWLRGPLSEMVTSPGRFYVSLDTTEFPDGALRGQLSENSIAAAD